MERETTMSKEERDELLAALAEDRAEIIVDRDATPQADPRRALG